MGSTSGLRWALARNAAVAPQPTECHADAYLAAYVKGSLRQMKVEMRQSCENLAVLSLVGSGWGASPWWAWASTGFKAQFIKSLANMISDEATNLV